MTGKNGLATKIAKVMEAVGYVPKTGNNAALGYKFVQASAVADKVRAELARLNVSMVPTTVDVVSEGMTTSASTPRFWVLSPLGR